MDIEFTERLDKAMDLVDGDDTNVENKLEQKASEHQPTLQEDGANEDAATNTEIPEESGTATVDDKVDSDVKSQPPTEETIDDKSNEDGTGESDEDQTIEPPNSWSGEDKELFNELPEWAQEAINTRESQREAHFSQRTAAVATKERELDSQLQQAQQLQQRHFAELKNLSEVATTLLPAKFSDIKNEADYLLMKSNDPARASQYDAFQRLVHNAKQQQAQLQQEQLEKHLANEFTQLASKYPEFQDPEKGGEILDTVRKVCVENYGFSPEEVAVIADHRHVPIIRDAMKWREHERNLKSAATKKVVRSQTKTIRRASTDGTSKSVTQDSHIINKARKAGSMEDQANLLASLL